MTPLTQGRDLAPDLLRSLNDAKDSFQRQSDGIFKVSGDLLGDNNRIIPMGQVSNYLIHWVDSTEVSRLLNPKRTVGKHISRGKEKSHRKSKKLRAQKPNGKRITRSCRKRNVPYAHRSTKNKNGC
jgi:hypothetical protein